MLGEGVYDYIRPETLRALHFYLGVGGADRFLTNISLERWSDADGLAVAHVQQFCKCLGDGCVACRLIHSISKEQGEAHKSEK